MFIALTQTAASVYQMMRGIIVVITAGLAVSCLGEKRYVHHWLSLLSIVTGVAIVGIVSINASKSDSKHETPTTSLGVILLLIS